MAEVSVLMTALQAETGGKAESNRPERVFGLAVPAKQSDCRDAGGLCVDEIRQDDLLSAVANIVHLSHPRHLA